MAMSKTITTKYFGQTDRLITARAKLALLIDITDHRINLLYDTVSSPQHSMHTGAKSIDRFINRVTLVRSTFVVRVEREREREKERESTAIRSRSREISTHAANSSWWTCHAWSDRLRVSLRPRNQRVHRRVFNTRAHYVMHICKSSFEPTHDPYTWWKGGEGRGWERTR